MRKTTAKGLAATILGIALLVLLVVPAFAQEGSTIPPPDVGGEVITPPGGEVITPPGGEVITPPGGLAFTGDEVTVWMVAAVGLLVVGSGLVFVARRRARATNK